MSWVNDIVGMMEQEKEFGGTIKLGEMTGPTTCKIGNLILTKEDLLFAKHLLTTLCKTVNVSAPNGGGRCSDNSIYMPALKAGDLVAVVQISQERFLVLERMVSA